MRSVAAAALRRLAHWLEPVQLVQSVHGQLVQSVHGQMDGAAIERALAAHRRLRGR